MKRYVTYKRVSTKEQGKSGLGLSAQERDIKLFLDNYSEEPWEIVGDFVEVETGTNADRPILKEAIALAKKHKATLLVAKLDRLSRKVSFISTLMDDKALKLTVASMPTADKFSLHIYAALAEQERDFISIRTKGALAEAKARGVKLGGLRDKTMKRNIALKKNAQDRAEKLRNLVEPMVKDDMSLRDMAKALNEAGIVTARGGAWGAVQVSRLVSRLA
ncbi:MAG: recombinase family protein [Rhodospirillaceae bacterium]|jgi:DNA invertase Pin-like site-specific DNA recombinase|nr:recombinase family protein [Rhodospirillaceae bacterium]MBT5243659.1 recombinase family protein [Rhodospirillaceae bacterium]MBT5561961.1 recombinase family protein [Rhodospirillaceae bacterium]MBT6240416.1 recombinase family protein [Rhodospirillaceae bacterium]MBT7137393.1 recombinase family protein [Rhodospirillaceae bacterium]